MRRAVVLTVIFLHTAHLRRGHVERVRREERALGRGLVGRALHHLGALRDGRDVLLERRRPLDVLGDVAVGRGAHDVLGHASERRDETRRDETRRDETRRDETRRDETRTRREQPIEKKALGGGVWMISAGETAAPRPRDAFTVGAAFDPRRPRSIVRAPPALLPTPLGRVVHAQVLVGALRVRGEDGRDGLGDERLRLSERLAHVPPDLAKRHSVSGFLFTIYSFFVHVPPDLVGRQHEALERERLRELAVREHALKQATPHIS